MQTNPSTENNSASSLTSLQKQKLKLINILTYPELHTTPQKKIAIINGSQKDSPVVQYSQPAPSTKGQKYVRQRKWKSYHRPSDTQFSLQRFAAEQRKNTNSNNNNRELVKKDENQVHQGSNVGPTLNVNTRIYACLIQCTLEK